MSNKYIAGNKAGGILEVPKKEVAVTEAQDIEVLLAKGNLVLSREISNLLQQSATGKLDAGCARDLVAYLKLLNELKREQQELLANLTDDALEKLDD